MAIYKLKYHCEKCKKDFYVNLHSKFEVSQKDLDRFTNEIKQKHDRKEHTYCTRCKKKIPQGKAHPKLMGRKDPTLEERQKGADFILLFGLFCEECNKILDKKESK